MGTNDMWAAYFWSGDALTLKHFFVFEFRDLQGTALNSQALVPIPSFPSSTFEWVTMDFIAIYELNTAGEAFANVDTLTVVPVPGAAWLLGSALAGLGWWMKRRG
jgi:hypothetical protein